MELKTGQTIAGKFLLQRGPETMGSVELWEATDLLLERPVTLEMLAAEASRDPAVCSAFLVHRQTASTIQHAGLLAVYDAGVWHGRPFSVMQRITGAPVGELYRPEYPPDLALILSVARQVAAALQVCRDSGLDDWRFTPDKVRVSPDGHAGIAMLDAPLSGSPANDPAEDVAALQILLSLMLTGETHGAPEALRAAHVPAAIIDLVSQAPNDMSGAGDFAARIAGIEAASSQPTTSIEAESQAVATTYPPDAPTVAAAILPVPYISRAHIPPTASLARSTPFSRLAVVGGLVLLLLLAVVSVPVLGAAFSNKAQAGPSVGVPALAPPAVTPTGVVVPDLRGKTVDEASTIARSAGLSLRQAAPAFDADHRSGTISSQMPPVGEFVAAGTVVTITLSIGAQPTAAAVAAPPDDGTSQQSSPGSPPAAQPPPPSNQNDKGKGDKGNGKDKKSPQKNGR